MGRWMVKLVFVSVYLAHTSLRATCVALCVAEGEIGHSPHENWVVLVTVQCIENFNDLLLSPTNNFGMV